MEFVYQGLADFHERLKNGKASCAEAVQHYLFAIERETALNALVAVFADEALQRAADLDLKWRNEQVLLPLHGLVVSLKDVFCYQDHPVTASSAMLKDFVAPYSSTVVQRLHAAGAVIIGTTSCDEFAMGSTNETSVYGPVLNAADQTRVPGGSSGGAAVSVQAGLCMAAIGSDTGGSVRQPADFCGVSGFKPSYGAISRYGLIAYASSFDTVGILSEYPSDILFIFRAVAGPDGMDATAAPVEMNTAHSAFEDNEAFPKIGWLKPALENPVNDPEITASLTGFLSALSQYGFSVSPVEFDLLEYIVPAYYVLTTAEASSNLSRYDGIRYGHATDPKEGTLTAFYTANRTGGFGSEVKRRIMLGNFVLSAGYYDAYFTRAQQVRHQIMEATDRIFNQFDYLILPVSPFTAPRLNSLSADPIAMYMGDIYTVFANLAGVPAMAIPLFRYSSGMPFGLQVLANRGQDLPLLRLAAFLEKTFSQKKTPPG
jgi:aspartyl-tRNA(Asn)/glutamyl-tRNA(Gln) amidotransferase subunit A